LTPRARLLFGTRIGDLIGRKLLTCDPETPVGEAARAMRREGLNAAVVLENGRVAGILSDIIDLRNNLVAEGASAATPVGRVVSADVVMLGGGASVFEALMAMMRERAFHVVVTDGVGAPLLGVVSDVDISRA
jgi:CBS domain-containing protein